MRRRWRAGSRAASSVMIENRASRQGVVRAIALSDHCRSRLDAEVGAHFLERDLDVPALHEPSYDLRGLARRFGAKQGLGREARLGIADEYESGSVRRAGPRAATPRCPRRSRSCAHLLRTSPAPQLRASACPWTRGLRRASAAVRLWSAGVRSCRATAAERGRRGLRRAVGG
jgi:hypothetical protein